MSLFWSAVPIFGWSYYSLEDGIVSCSVEYNEKSLNVISYNIGMFIFVFILPFGITIYTNIKSILIVKLFFSFIKFAIIFDYIIITMKQIRDRSKQSIHIQNKKLLKAETKITISMIVYIGKLVHINKFLLILNFI